MDNDTCHGIFNKESSGYYVCGCGHFGTNKEKLYEHKSKLIEGVCLNGMCLGDKSLYKCVCKKVFESSKDAEKHSKQFHCVSVFLDITSRKCGICNLICRNVGELKRHETTKKHLERTNVPPINLYCNTCKIQCLTQKQIKVHLETKKHKKLVFLGEVAKEKMSLRCEICNITFYSQPHIRIHLETKKHKDMVASGKVAEPKIPLHCYTCKITCPSQSTMRTHLQTKKHERNIREKIFELVLNIVYPNGSCDSDELNTQKRRIKQLIDENDIRDLSSVDDISQSISAQETNE